jgi:hypothetical protein
MVSSANHPIICCGLSAACPRVTTAFSVSKCALVRRQKALLRALSLVLAGRAIWLGADQSSRQGRHVNRLHQMIIKAYGPSALQIV